MPVRQPSVSRLPRRERVVNGSGVRVLSFGVRSAGSWDLAFGRGVASALGLAYVTLDTRDTLWLSGSSVGSWHARSYSTLDTRDTLSVFLFSGVWLGWDG